MGTYAYSFPVASVFSITSKMKAEALKMSHHNMIKMIDLKDNAAHH